MRLPAAERIDALNIVLIILSAILAVFMPFELFLFSYAIFGPLHYLTEISWLHDKKYFTKHRNDFLYLIAIATAISFVFVNSVYKFVELEIPTSLPAILTWTAVALAILFVTVKKTVYRLLGLIAILVTMKIATNNAMTVYLTVFLPTLLHVYIFTGLFMLYGALKSKSRMGLAAVATLIICPILLMTLLPGMSLYDTTEYARRTYTGDGTHVTFLSVSIQTIHSLFGTTVTATTVTEGQNAWLNHVFHSSNGMAVARLIGFAYTYHYLNWFSKTKIIQWHKVPKLRFVVVIAAWLASVALYAIDFTTGMVWLFFLSLMHVLLELPLNAVSVLGIYSLLKARMSKKNTEEPQAIQQKRAVKSTPVS